MMLDIRANVPDGAETLRTQIVNAVKEQLIAAPFLVNDDATPNYVRLFEEVAGGTLEDIDMNMTPAARLEEGDENPDPLMYELVDETFRLYVHFKVVATLGVDAQPLINYYFARITQTLVTPEHFADIAFDISEVGNSIQYQGKSDPEPGGTVFYDIQYRHGRGNRFAETGNE